METSKTKNGKTNTSYISFSSRICENEKVFPILARKRPNSEERIFAVCKYSRRLSKRTLSPKFLSNNLSLWLFYD